MNHQEHEEKSRQLHERIKEIEAGDWGEGPWTDEPDRANWVDPETDLDCMIVRNRFGALCGYVGVPEGHPWFGLDYDRVHEKIGLDAVQVHGGLTYAAPCEGEICHVPEPGRPEVWWLGFDCAHAFDYVPAHEAIHREMAKMEYTSEAVAREATRFVKHLHYWEWEEVVAEVESLARQAKRAGME